MNEQQLKELIDRHIDIYINNIAFELEKNHDKWFDNFGFPIFGESSKHYYEQVYFQSYLESYTRQMINGIMRELVAEETADNVTWPEADYNGVYSGYTNIEFEKEFGFEFINHDTRVGYLYSYFHPEEIEKLFEQENVEKIVIVIWADKEEIIGFEYEDDRIKVILLWDLFQELFFELDKEEIDKMYSTFVNKITKAVETVKSMISLVTVPGFTPSYQYKTRNEVAEKLKKEVKNLSCFYVETDDFKQNEINSKKLIDEYKLSQFFLENRFENVFIGISDFAKSYLTSEYLYTFFKDNRMFDYTAVVSGYIKSIEQLLHTICTSYYFSKGILPNFSDYTLGKYITEMEKNWIIKRELVPVKKVIIGCLKSYKQESRNNLFHKDYLDSWSKVEQIRLNTIFLYVVLFGAVDPVFFDASDLGVLNTKYDQMFSMLDMHNNGMFSFTIDGKEYIKMAKEPRDTGLVFNENGLIMNTMVFKNNYFDMVEMSRFNMPSEIWLTDAAGKKQQKLWPFDKRSEAE